MKVRADRTRRRTQHGRHAHAKTAHEKVVESEVITSGGGAVDAGEGDEEEAFA